MTTNLDKINNLRELNARPLPPPLLFLPFLLSQLTWRVDYNTVGRTEAERALTTLENKVKVGDVRATLVIQTLTNAADVTLNAGTSY